MTKKRDRDNRDNAYLAAYHNFRYKAVENTGKPGTPHRYFAESYTVHPTGTSGEGTMQIHRHANSLCIVTVGSLLSASTTPQSFKMLKRADPPAAGAKRNKKKSLPNGVKPDQPLCTIQTEDGREISVPCAVRGTILEVNPNLNCDVLKKDPIFSGYLAVIMPTGPFPPWNDDDEKDDSKCDEDASDLREAKLPKMKETSKDN